MPDISILIPIYDPKKKDIISCFNSIASQTYQNFIVVCIEDPINGENVKFNIEDFLKKKYKDMNIKYVLNKKKVGLIKSLNKGIKMIKTTYIARMDIDDMMSPERLHLQRRFLKRHNDISIVGSNMTLINDNGDKTGIRKYPKKHNDILKELVRSSPLGHPTVMMDLSRIKDEYHYNQEFMNVEDYELWIRLLTKGFKAHNIQKTLHLYRVDNQSIVDTQIKRMMKQHKKIRKMIYKELKKSFSYYIISIVMINLLLILPTVLLKKLYYKYYLKSVKIDEKN